MSKTGHKILEGAREAIEVAKKLRRIRELIAEYPEPWVIEKEPHNYNDGTTEFTHVRYYHKPKFSNGETICVEIGSHVTPDLAELLVLLREVAPMISMGGTKEQG